MVITSLVDEYGENQKILIRRNKKDMSGILIPPKLLSNIAEVLFKLLLNKKRHLMRLQRFDVYLCYKFDIKRGTYGCLISLLEKFTSI